MARKGRKTRWRKLPIPIGNNQGGETCCAPNNVPNLEPEHPSSPIPKEQVSRVTFNEDEYTKITTPRQDMLFKKGYLSKKKPQPQEQHASYTSPEPSHSPSESVESEQYVGCDDGAAFPPPFMYPAGYMDPSGMFYVNGGSYEVYDPYTNSVMVIYGPGSGYPNQPVLTAVPCHPVPLQPIEWFAPPPQQNNFKKRNSTDSQHWGSSQSCESPSSGHELESQDSLYYPQPQYVYPGYMFGAPLYNINGVSVQGAAPPPPHQSPPHHPSQHQNIQQHAPQQADQPKRRKKRRKRRRPGMGDDGSESSCEEVAGSGVSSDAGQGSSCSKTTDSGVHTGADSPQPQSSPVPHDTSSPPPEVSTEEEPSQLSISHIPLDNTNRMDSSTEDETNLHDTSLQSLIAQTETICIKKTNGMPDSESEGKEITVDDEEICIEPLLDNEVFLGEASQSPILEKSSESFSSNVAPNEFTPHIIENSKDNQIIKLENPDSEKFPESTLECIAHEEPVLNTEPVIEEFIAENSDSVAKSSSSSSTEMRPACLVLDESPEITSECLALEESLESTHENFVIKALDTSTESPCQENSFEKATENGLSEECAVVSLDSSSLEESHSKVEPEDSFVAENKTTLLNSAVESTISSYDIVQEESPEVVNLDVLDSPDINVTDKVELEVKEESFSTQVFQENISLIARDDSDEWLNALEKKEENDVGGEILEQIPVLEEGHLPVLEEDQIPVLEEIPTEVICFTSESPLDTPLFTDETTVFEFKDETEECIVEETGYSEEGWGSAEETSLEERWALAELGEEVTVDKPITEAVTRWLESQGSKALGPQPHVIESEDEGIGEETSSPTGPKNVKGNPFLVRYPSTGTRVANSCENEAYTWRTKCDPMLSVDRYYRLGAESPPLASSFKTAKGHSTLLHIDPSLPFPCGLVCCILQ